MSCRTDPTPPPRAPVLRPLVGALLLLCGCASTPHRIGLEGGLASGVDTQAGREVGAERRAQPLLAAELLLEGRAAATDQLEARGRYELGMRAYPLQPESDLLAQSAALELEQLLPGQTLASLGASARDRRTRSGSRSWQELSATLGAAAALGPLRLRLDGALTRTLWLPNPAFSASAPAATVEVALPLPARHRVALSGDLAWRRFDAHSALLSVDGLSPRRDLSGGLRLAWRWRGPVRLGAAYRLGLVDSSLPGFSEVRHRLEAEAAVGLPLELVLAARGALVRASYPQGLALAPQLALAQDDENASQLSASLQRELPGGLSVELSGALFRASLQSQGLPYARELLQLRLGWRH